MTARRSGGLFVDEQRRTASGSQVKSTANARRPPTPRKAPLQQSSSEGEPSPEVQDSEDSLIGELRRKRKAKEKAERREAGKGPGSSILQKKKKKQLTDTAPETISGIPKSHEKGPQRANVSAVTTKTTLSTASGQNRTVMATTTAPETTDNAVSKTGGKAVHTAPPKQTNPGINFVDGPRERRREWSNTDTHFKKLHFRALAEKRARTEATPDFGELNFVNGPPPSLPKAVRNPSSDPYARRDITNHRVQEEDPDDRPRVGQDARPLASWEKDKFPMMCNAWKLSSNCVYGAERCNFMHRTHDPEGRPYQLGDIHNRVPQKYRKPPITCEYWYNGNRCKKPAEDCLYAHEDTGWTEVNGKPIEREHVAFTSVGSTPRDAPHVVPFKLQNPPVTCHYWLRDSDGCTKSEANCKYAHWNTGWAPPEHKSTDPPVQIDPNLRPRGVAPKHANPPITCPYWLKLDNGCSRADDECKFAHFNTGWTRTSMGQGQTVRMNPQQLPRSQSRGNTRLKEDVSISSGLQTSENVPVPLGSRNRDRLEPKLRSPPITCANWLRHAHGCRKSDTECEFAHNNTGWISGTENELDISSPVQINRNEEPRTGPARFRVNLARPRDGNPPITCFFWLDNLKGCKDNAADCRFAHRNTGWMIHYGQGNSTNPEQIDPLRKPRFWKYGK
jgi:hypothetical protein